MKQLPPRPAGIGAGIASGIAGALQLAKGHSAGIARIASDPSAAPVSFWAAAFCLPLMLVLRASDTPFADRSMHDILAPVLLYVVGWAGYALLSRRIAIAMGREARWPVFIAAWNWCNLIQYALFLIASVPGWAGAPDWLGQTLGIVALFWAMWLQWFATRTALDIGAWRAVALVALDVLVGIVLAG